MENNPLVPKLRFPEFRDAPGWGGMALSDVATIVMGSSPKSECYNESQIGLPLLQGNADIKNRLSAPRIFTSEITKECTIGDILLSVRAPVGSVAKSVHHACIGRGIAAVKAAQPNSQEFVYQWLLFYEPRWGSISQGGTFDAVNSDDLRRVALAVPSPAEQQKIAECLTSLDELIAAEGRKLDALRSHKKGLMQNLFPREGETTPRLRFPEFQDIGEWDKSSLGKVCRFVRGPFGGALKKEVFVRAGFAVYEQSHAIENQMRHFRYFITEEKYEEMRRFAVQPNDLIMSCSGTMGRFAQLPQVPVPGVINQALLKLTVHDGWNVRFVLLMLGLPTTQSKLLSQSAGGAIKNVVGVPELKGIEIFMPREAEQQKIAECLTSLDSLITAQAKKLDTLKRHKQGLMQGLFPSLDEGTA